MKTLLEQENLEPRVDKAGGAANNDSNDFFKIFSKHMDAIMLKVSGNGIMSTKRALRNMYNNKNDNIYKKKFKKSMIRRILTNIE